MNDTLINALTSFSLAANTAGVTTTAVAGAGGIHGKTPGNCGTGAGGFRAGNSCQHATHGGIKGLPAGFKAIPHVDHVKPTKFDGTKEQYSEYRDRQNVKLPVTKWTPETGHTFIGHVERDATLPGDPTAPFHAFDAKGKHVGTFHSTGLPSAIAQQKAERAVHEAHRTAQMSPGEKTAHDAGKQQAKKYGGELKKTLKDIMDKDTFE